MGRKQTVMPEDRSDSLQHYYATRDAKRDQRRKACKAYYREKMRRLYEYLLSHPCVDCDEPDPVVLQFDHIRGRKVDTVANLIRTKAWYTVLVEIKKCEVRCANCHLKRHASDAGQYKQRYTDQLDRLGIIY